MAFAGVSSTPYVFVVATAGCAFAAAPAGGATFFGPESRAECPARLPSSQVVFLRRRPFQQWIQTKRQIFMPPSTTRRTLTESIVASIDIATRTSVISSETYEEFAARVGRI